MKPCFEKYSRVAAATREVFATYDPDFEACSLDEACLDITDYCAAHGMTGVQHRESAPACIGCHSSGRAAHASLQLGMQASFRVHVLRVLAAQ